MWLWLLQVLGCLQCRANIVRHGGNELCYFRFWCHLWMEREWIDLSFSIFNIGTYSWFRLMNVFHGFQHRRDHAVLFTCFLIQSKEEKKQQYKSVNEILWNHKYVFIFLLFFFAGVFIFYGFATIAMKIVVMQKNIQKRVKIKRSATHSHRFVIYRKIWILSIITRAASWRFLFVNLFAFIPRHQREIHQYHIRQNVRDKNGLKENECVCKCKRAKEDKRIFWYYYYLCNTHRFGCKWIKKEKE